MTTEPPTTVALNILRRHVAALLSQIDTATLPQPDKVHGKREDSPGCEWNPQKGWRVRTVEDADSAGFVYVDHNCDDIAYRWGVPGDWECLRIEDARQIGMAFLAAAHRAEELFAGVSRLDVAHADHAPETGVVASVSSIQPRGRRGR